MVRHNGRKITLMLLSAFVLGGLLSKCKGDTPLKRQPPAKQESSRATVVQRGTITEKGDLIFPAAEQKPFGVMIPRGLTLTHSAKGMQIYTTGLSLENLQEFYDFHYKGKFHFESGKAGFSLNPKMGVGPQALVKAAHIGNKVQLTLWELNIGTVPREQ